jgi:hypothetical protein
MVIFFLHTLGLRISGMRYRVAWQRCTKLHGVTSQKTLILIFTAREILKSRISLGGFEMYELKRLFHIVDSFYTSYNIWPVHFLHLHVRLVASLAHESTCHTISSSVLLRQLLRHVSGLGSLNIFLFRVYANVVGRTCTFASERFISLHY